MKRFLYTLIFSVAFICLFALFVGAVDVDGVSYSLNNNASPPTASVTGFVQGANTVKIPSTVTVSGVEYRVTAITGTTNKAASNTLKELYITGEYITKIVSFEKSSNLQKIYITSPIAEYPNGCFRNCTAVTDVYIDFSHTTRINAYAFFFSNNESGASKAVWNYNGEAINLYNVNYIGNHAFISSRIGGKFSGGTENTIIWPKLTTFMGKFCFSNCYLGGTVYLNCTNVESNKQFSLNNSFETLIIGPDTATIYNFNNGGDTGLKNSLNNLIILSKQLVNGNDDKGKPRTNLFDNWGTFDIYYYSDIQAVIDKQTTIGGATHHVIDSHTLSYSNACSLTVEVFSSSNSLKRISNTHHAYDLQNGTVNEDYCPVGSTLTVSCACGQATKDKLNYGYLESAKHVLSTVIQYKNGFHQSGVIYTSCSVCGEESTNVLSPIITSLGYSADSNSGGRKVIASGYTVDAELVDLYNSANGTALEIGIFFADAESVSKEAPASLDGFKYLSNGGVNEYSTYNFKIRFPSESDPGYSKYAKAEFVASAFIFDGKSYFFYQGLDIDSTVNTLASGFVTTTLNKLLGIEDEVCTDDPYTHTYNESSWKVITLATKYTSGARENVCTECSFKFTEEIPYTATVAELAGFSNDYLYTGGKYENEVFINLSTLGRAYATSYFAGTSAINILDRDYTTFWSADTYADGADYTGDYIVLELPEAYDVGTIALTVPNYTYYGLGEGCYVSYDVEYMNESGQWVYLDTVSDRDITTSGKSGVIWLELDAPITARQIKFSVSHASRYAPATIYELEVLGKAKGFSYDISSISGQASVSCSGRYNDWSSYADAAVDGSLSTYWYTDVRWSTDVWAILEFSEEKFIACVQVAIASKSGRAFAIDIFENGEWVQIGYTYSANGVLSDTLISNANGISTVNIDVERTTTKIRFRIVSDPENWSSKVYEITPYTINGISTDEEITECKHTTLTKSKDVSATCDRVGYTLMACDCGATVKTNITDIRTHIFGDYSVLTAATPTSVGTKIAYCANCDATCTVTYEDGYEAPVVTSYRHDAPAAWAQTFDDGNYFDTYDWVIPQLQKYGYRATALLTVSFAGANVSNWNEYLASGVFDIGSHSYSHGNYYSASVDEQSLLSDVVNAQYWLRANFTGQKVLTFAAPNGATSDAVANYLTGIVAANRNGGQGYAFYNVISDLEAGRSTWGNLNSYVSKADQSEGDYVFTNADGSAIYVLDGSGSYVINNSYASKGINLVFDEDAGTYVNKGFEAGTYIYSDVDYRYDFSKTGSYNLVGGRFVFVNDNSGEYRLVKATLGTYESAIDTLVSKGAFTVECIHTISDLPNNMIYSTHASTVSKFEYLAKRGVWAPSYQDLVMYLKEAQNAKIDTVARTDKSVTINVTDTLDDYMFDYALTVKVDIDDRWQAVYVTQNGVEIPLVSIDEYRASKNMSTVSCAIENGYLYVDVVPDGGEVVITSTAVLDEKDDGNGQIGVDIWDLLG